MNKIFRHLSSIDCEETQFRETRLELFIQSLDLIVDNKQRLDVNDIPDHLLDVWIVNIEGLEYWDKMLHSIENDDRVPDYTWIAFCVFFTLYIRYTGISQRFQEGKPYCKLFSHEDFFLYAVLFQDILAFVQSERRQGRSVLSFDVMNLGLYLEYNMRNIPKDFITEWIDHSKRGMPESFENYSSGE